MPLSKDVAAGLAIVEGAGGRIAYESTPVSNAFDVRATNGLVPLS